MASANFDYIARLYRILEYLTLGPMLQRCRAHFIPRLLDRRHTLVLGDGDGRFLEQLLAANLEIQADAVDTSAAMLDLLRQRCGAGTRLRTHQQNALNYEPASGTDLVTAHFFFDCLTQPELDALIVRLADQIRPDALWLISDFRIPAGALHLPARAFVRSLYLAFRVLTSLRTTRLPDHEASLLKAGITRTAQHLSLCGLLTTELWSRNSP